MDTDRVRSEIVIVAMNKMLKNSHFSICTFTEVAEVLGVRPEPETFAMLRLLHCVDYSAMPKNVRDSIPELIVKCLGAPPPFQFPMPEQEKPIAVVSPSYYDNVQDADYTESKSNAGKGMLALLFGKK